jgi:hypothetical protein
MKLSNIQDRHVLLAFICALAVAICRGGVVFGPGSPGLLALTQDHSGIDVGELLAFAVLTSIVLRFRDEEILSPIDLLVLAASSLAFAVPFRLAAIVPLIAVGTRLIFRQEPRVSSIGQLLLALVFYEWVGRVLFRMFAPFFLIVEARIVQMVLSIGGEFRLEGLIITGSNGHGVYIEAGCSAFHNLSFAMLIWISLVKLETVKFRTAHWWILAGMALATVTVNTARIALMAQSYAMFAFWHEGPGVSIVSFTMLAAILAVFVGGRFLVTADD